MMARYYSPETAFRFLSVDPGGVEPENPASWNRYVYVENSPVRYTDPDGKVKFEGNAEAKYGEAKSYLSKSKAATKLFGKLEKLTGSAEPTLRLNDSGRVGFDPDGGSNGGPIIHWDPAAGLDVSQLAEPGVPDSDGNTIQSPSIGLVHEVDHAVASGEKPKKFQNRQQAPAVRPGISDKEEERVITKSERKIGQQMDEPRRRSDIDPKGTARVKTKGSTSKERR